MKPITVILPPPLGLLHPTTLPVALVSYIEDPLDDGEKNIKLLQQLR
ncbi:MAG UNVERIFIED_CONTAM: hypothetical protein LVR29_23310 [Microcystis novacekii LVE1205-3]